MILLIDKHNDRYKSQLTSCCSDDDDASQLWSPNLTLQHAECHQTDINVGLVVPLQNYHNLPVALYARLCPSNCLGYLASFLRESTNLRVYATGLCPSVVCNVCIVAKRCILPKNCPNKQLGNRLCGIEWSRDLRRHVTPKGRGRDPSTLRAQYLENDWR